MPARTSIYWVRLFDAFGAVVHELLVEAKTGEQAKRWAARRWSGTDHEASLAIETALVHPAALERLRETLGASFEIHRAR